MITDQRAVKFTNEVVRPLSEDIRNLVARIEAAKISWFAGTNVLFPNRIDAALDDGRDGEGVSRLTGADVNSFMAIAINMQAASNAEIISKPTVRAMKIG